MDEVIHKIFSEFGEIQDMRIHKFQNGRRRGTGHIDFVSKDGVVAALASVAQRPIELEGRRLRIECSQGTQREPVTIPSEKLFYKGYIGKESEIRTICEQFSDHIVSVQQLKDPRTNKLGPSGFIGFNSVENATIAMEALDGAEAPNGGFISLAYARGMKNKHENDKLHYFVYAPPSEESEIRSIFQKYDESIVNVLQLKTPLRNGFVTFNSVETAKEALETLNNTPVLGGELVLSYAIKLKPKRSRSRTSKPKSD